jgi:hypothetical protein
MTYYITPFYNEKSHRLVLMDYSFAKCTICQGGFQLPFCISKRFLIRIFAHQKTGNDIAVSS